MAKDPAFLFYYQDFLVGTQFMSDEAVGVYIRLLCHQADKGSLTSKHIKSICSDCSDKDEILEKFKKDSNGTFFNVRLREESEKRRKYSESRRKNAKHKKSICSTHAPHMEDVNEDENEDVVVDYESIVSVISELPDIDLANKIITTMVHGTIKSFIFEFPEIELHKTSQWREYIDRLKMSDWIMGETIGKNARLFPLSLDFVCSEKTLLKAFSDGYKNREIKEDARAFI
jgi:uncharacterized protein YdaU (DUF1376 family)